MKCIASLRHVFALSILLSLNACSSNEHEKIAIQFIEAFYTQQFDEAKRFATPRTDTLIDQIAQFIAQDTSTTKLHTSEIDAKKLLLQTEIEGDTCIITYKNPLQPDQIEQLHLLKQKSKWQVEMSLLILSPQLYQELSENPPLIENPSGEVEDPRDTITIQVR